MMNQKNTYWTMLSPLIRRSMEKRYSEVMANYAIKNGKENYLRILGEAEDLGDGNPLEPAAHAAFIFVGCWLGTGKMLSADGMANVMGDVIKDLRPFFLLMNLNSARTQRKISELLNRYVAWSGENAGKFPETWAISLREEPRGIAFTMTRCPVVTYCREAGIPQILPALERGLEQLIAALHGTLHHGQTLYTGADSGDYLITGDKVTF